MLKNIVAILLWCSVFDHTTHGLTPEFPPNHHVKGFVDLPYAELHEPFEFWVVKSSATQESASRLDWYGGLDTVLDKPSLGDYGTQFKISYTTLNYGSEMKTQDCFEIPGSSDGGPVVVDRVLPDLTNFTDGGTVNLDGQKAQMMYKKEIIGSVKNTYKFYYKQTSGSIEYIPLKYSFLGYDSLLGSHYDRYDIEYLVFDQNIPQDTFSQVLQNKTCHGFPGPGAAKKEHQIMLNPMYDLVQSSRYDEAHREYQKEFGKKYESKYEHRKAATNYMHNLRLIHFKNRQSLSYKLKVNHMADMSREEREASFMGLKRIQDGRVPQGNKLGPDELKNKDTEIPDYWDWRIEGAVTQVKDQAICGSCWSFGATGSMEGAFFLKYGTSVRLSQQNLMDCSWVQGNNGCDGGEDWRAYEYIQSSEGGLMSEEDYGAYLGQNGRCHLNQTKSLIKIANYTFVKGEDADTVKSALLNHGPLSIGIDASLPSFSFYSHGLYDDPQCKNGVDQLDHQVLLVGYGKMEATDGQKDTEGDEREYWLVKNSWSTYWGNLGYVTFAVKDNICGVMTQPTFVTLE